jgi:DNA-binding CsgD family transcriptional regulator
MWLVGTSAAPNSNLPFRLDTGAYIVGRAKSAQIVIRDATVSRRHARLVRTPELLLLEDLVSANGTFVNGLPVTQLSLRLGDNVRFGGVPCGISLSPLALRTPGDEESTYEIPRTEDGCKDGQLTSAQLEIVALIEGGLSEMQIAARLHKSPHTIHTHVKAIYRRLSVHTRAELILKLLNRG